MDDKKAIEVIRAECYRMNMLDMDESTLINKALDRAVDALKERIEKNDKRDQELIRKFREAQNGHRVDGGFYRGVSACLRIVLNEYEIPEPPGDFETRGCCQ